jgi:hypothetical protein
VRRCEWHLALIRSEHDSALTLRCFLPWAFALTKAIRLRLAMRQIFYMYLTSLFKATRLYAGSQLSASN